ncbi:hypothetical protein [Pseudomonas fluorescens]|uniref:hypothetical protein n=1 Tax=Pseudomonas fluorescens TaxID=294 RepID=UPI001A9F3D12|nr:hypothetical protein [Pseudomonas fluorescens]QTD31481.1 hypothetical protein JZM58_19530 [Pseudomonas fluorescens]
MKCLKSKLAMALALLCLADQARAVQNFVSLSAADFLRDQHIIEQSPVEGAQIIYKWTDLEAEEDGYDFSRVEQDLAYLSQRNKKLIVQVQDYFYEPQDDHVPQYLKESHQRLRVGGHAGAQGQADVERQWNSQVRRKYQRLLAGLASKFDGQVYAVSLPQTLLGVSGGAFAPAVSCESYFSAAVDNMHFAKVAFQKTFVVQNVNFWPCEPAGNRLSRLFALAERHSVGLEGGGIVLGRGGRVKKHFPYFHEYRGKLPLVVVTVHSLRTAPEDPLHHLFSEYADDYLGADVVLWDSDAHWLKPSREKALL